MEDWNYDRILLDAKTRESKYRKMMEHYKEAIKFIEEAIKKQEVYTKKDKTEE